MKHLLLTACIIVLFNNSQACAIGELHDEYSLELKGFSPELIYPAEVQISRMEGRYPPPAPTKAHQFFLNLVNNEWTGNLKAFPQHYVFPPMSPIYD